MNKVRPIVQKEMKAFRDSITTCGLTCHDATVKQFGHIADDPEANKSAIHCMALCIDKQIALLQTIHKRLERDIDKAIK